MPCRSDVSWKALQVALIVALSLIANRAGTEELRGVPTKATSESDDPKFFRTPGIAVPGRYHVILVFTVPADDVEQISRRLAAAHKLRILRIRDHGFEAEGTEENAREASHAAAVQFVTEHDRSRDWIIPPDKFVKVTDPEPGRYHVELADQVSLPTDEAVRRTAERLVARYGGTIGYAWGEMNAFSLRATESIARSMAADPAVSVVRQYPHMYWNRGPEVSPEGGRG